MNTKNSSTLTKRYKTALSAIHIISRLIKSTNDSKELLLRVCRLITQVLNARMCKIVISDTSRHFISVRVYADSRLSSLVRSHKKINNPREKKIILSGSLITEANYLGIPLIAEDFLGGIMVISRTIPQPFDSIDQEIAMNLGEQLIMAIKNIRLLEEQEKLLLGSVKSLIAVLNTKSPHVSTHTKDFNQLLLAIAEQMRLPENEVHALLYAGLLHDAGKVDIPQKILTKSAKLTGKEYRMIKEHPLIGARLIKPLQLLKPAIPIIQHHHEKFDGTGYPTGLKKNQIPVGARIMAVADAFEAMVKERPYRKKTLSTTDAIKEIRKNAGTQFDPKVIEALVKALCGKRLKRYLSHSNHRNQVK